MERERKLSEAALKWIRGRTMTKTARDLGVITRTAQNWVYGQLSPRPEKVRALIALAATEGVVLGYEDFYGVATPPAPPTTPGRRARTTKTSTTQEQR